VQAHPLFHEDGRRHAPFLAQDAQEEVFGPDVVVQEPIGLFGRALEDPLGLRTERNFDRGGDLLAEDRPTFDFLADVFQGEM
jgi:hypothetical protein